MSLLILSKTQNRKNKIKQEMCLQNKSSKKSLQILPKSIVINIPFGAMYHTYVALLCINVGMHVIWNVPHIKVL